MELRAVIQHSWTNIRIDVAQTLMRKVRTFNEASELTLWLLRNLNGAQLETSDVRTVLDWAETRGLRVSTGFAGCACLLNEFVHRRYSLDWQEMNCATDWVLFDALRCHSLEHWNIMWDVTLHPDEKASEVALRNRLWYLQTVYRNDYPKLARDVLGDVGTIVASY
jgi:hypothetical protein